MHETRLGAYKGVGTQDHVIRQDEDMEESKNEEDNTTLEHSNAHLVSTSDEERRLRLERLLESALAKMEASEKEHREIEAWLRAKFDVSEDEHKEDQLE